MRLLLISNPKVAKGEDAQSIRSALTKAGATILEPQCKSRVEITSMVRAHIGSIDGAVVLGGDGTLNACAAGLIGTGVPVGVVPLGTANDFAHTLRIPADTDEAIAVVLAGRTQAVDAGSANDRFFLNAASIGLGPNIVRALQQGTKKRILGAWAYPLAAARVIRRSRSFAATLSVGEQRLKVRSRAIVVGNGKHFGGGWLVGEQASLDDEIFNVSAWS